MRWRHSIFESSMVWSYFRINAILYGAKAIQDEKYKSRDKFAISFSTGFFFRRYFSSVWLNWLQNVNNKKEDQRQNIFENERKMLQFLYSVWKWFRNAHDAISFNCSNHCWSFFRWNVLNVDVVMWIRNIIWAKCAKNKHPFIPIHSQTHVLRYARQSSINVWTLLP